MYCNCCQNLCLHLFNAYHCKLFVVSTWYTYYIIIVIINMYIKVG